MHVTICIAPGISELVAFCARAKGNKTVIFCEDRLTLEAESALVRARGAVFDASVTTFARFLGGAKGKKTLSKQGSVMVVGSVAAEHAAELTCFGKNPAGCAARLYETIAQLRAACVTPEMLEAARAGADPFLAQKLGDIALVYRGYLDFLARGYLDESGVLALLPEAIAAGGLDGADVVFAGFSSFTRQAAEGIAAALRCARSVTGVFLGGEEDLYTNEGADAFEKYCRAAGAECSRTALPSALCPAAEQLRKCLFDPAYPVPMPSDSVYVYEAADTDEELCHIAAMIRREVFAGRRFSDIALFLPDVKGYAVRLEQIFSEYAVPYYADVKKSVAAHPLARFALLWLSLLAEGFEPADADAFLANPFFGGDRVSRERLRNYLLRYANYRGGVRRPVREEAEEPLVCESLRARFLSAFEGASASMTGAGFCRGLRRLFDLFESGRVQEEIAASLEEAGMRAESSYFSRGLETVLRVLDEAETLLGGTKMRAEEFASLFSESLSAAEISLIPQYLDAVFVGDLAESKKCAVPVVFAAGLTSDVPAGGADTALISDRDIDRLRALQVEISPKIREVNARVRENVGLALCGFTERLYLSYPLSRGKEECKPSALIDTVRACFRTPAGAPLSVLDRARVEGLERTDAAAYLRYLAFETCERQPAVRALLVRADAYRRGAKDFGAMAGVLAALDERGDAPVPLLYAPARPPAFVPAAAQVLLGGKNTLSPTLVEGYYNCPYRNFAERGLLLREREETSVRAVDTGDFMHELLRLLAGALDSLPDEEACAAFVGEQARKLLEVAPYSYLKDTLRGTYSADVLARDASLICRGVFRQIRDSDFSVAYAEQTFGYPSSPIGGVRLRGEGRDLFLAGKIDRVDVAGEYARVVDYKTGHFDVSAAAYYTGRKLQLPLYLYAAAQGRRAAGAYYFPAKVEFHKADEQPFRMQGFTVRDEAVVRMNDKTVADGEKSRYIDAYCGGRFAKGLAGEDFSAFLEYAVLSAQACARETAQGCIAPAPYEGACTYCPYGGVCGYDASAGTRSADGVTPEEIVRIVRREKGEI